MSRLATSPWRFEWRRRWDDVWASPFEREWGDLFAHSESAHVYHRPSLVRAWAETCGRATNIEPMVGMARSSGGSSVLMPWVVVRYTGRLSVRRTLEPAGAEVFGYHSPLVSGANRDRIDWARFWGAARVEVGGACDQALFRLLEPEYAVGVPASSRSEDSPVLDLRGIETLDDVLAACSSSHRVDVKRQLRRLREQDVLALWVAGEHDVAAAIDSLRSDLLPAYRALWGTRERPNALLRPDITEFLERLLTIGIPEGWVHYSVLKVGRKPIAWHLGFTDRQRLYWWLTAYDAAWANYSPGKTLLASPIDLGARSGWTEVHLLQGNQDYKSVWRPRPSELAAVRWTAPTFRGRVMAWYDATWRAS